MKCFSIAFLLLALVRGFEAQVGTPNEENAGLRIEGTVVQDPEEQPVRKANVQMIGQSGKTPARHSAITDVEGRFTIEGLTPGRYAVMIDRAGLVQAGKGRTAISVLQNRTGLIFHVQPAAVITGKITDADGDPMRYVGVAATNIGLPRALLGRDSGSATTNDIGEFRIADLRPGQYTVAATPPQGMQAPGPDEKGGTPGQFVYVTTYYPGTSNQDAAVPVDAQPGGETPVNISIASSRAYRVAGDVTGLPVGALGSTIMLTSPHKIYSEQQLGEGGRFEFSGIVPGTYHAHVIVFTGLGDGIQPGAQVLQVEAPIEVANSDLKGLHLHADQGTQVRGRFQTDTGQKIDWTQLTVLLLQTANDNDVGIQMGPSFRRPNFSAAKPDGSFELNDVPSGNYHLVVGSRSSSDTLRDYFTKSVILDGQDVGDSGFRTGPGTYLQVVISAKGASIGGTVVDADGKPVPYATVIDLPNLERRSRPDLYQQDTTDEHGHFSLRGLNPGSYTVLAFEDLPGSVREPELLNTFGTRGEKVQVDEGAYRNVVLKVIPAGQP